MSQLQGHEVFVTTEDGGSNIGISLVGPLHATPLVSMNPSRAASLEQTLLRLAQKFEKAGIATGALALAAKSDSHALDAGKADNSEWVSGNRVLLVGSDPIPVVLNPPSCKSIQLPRRWIVGCALRPRVELEFAQLSLSTVRWLRASAEDGGAAGAAAGEECDVALVGEGWEYTPTEADVGFRLLVEVVPARAEHNEEEGHSCSDKDGSAGAEGAAAGSGRVLKGRGVRTGLAGGYSSLGGGGGGGGGKVKKKKGADAHVEKLAVEGAPPLCPLQAIRQGHIASVPLPSNAIRVCSYNILCDQFCDAEWARQNLYAHCDRRWLDVEYRVPLLLRELRAYGAGVVCLQEVEKKTWDTDLLPRFEAWGMCGWFSLKTKASTWGCAMVWARDRLALRSQETQYLYSQDEWKKYPPVVEVCAQSEEVEASMKACGTIAQFAVFDVLEPASAAPAPSKAGSSTLIVGNYHLFGNPEAPQIRILQMAMMLWKMQDLVAALGPGAKGKLLLCGDANAEPGSGALDLALNRKVEGSHVDFAEGLSFRNLATRGAREALWNCKLSPAETAAQKNVFRTVVGAGGMRGTLDVAKLEHLLADRGLSDARSAIADVDERVVPQESTGRSYAWWFSWIKAVKVVAGPAAFPAVLRALEAMAAEEAGCMRMEQESEAGVLHAWGMELTHSLVLEQRCPDVPASYWGLGGSGSLVDFILDGSFGTPNPPSLPPFPSFSPETTQLARGLPSQICPSDHIPLLADLVMP